MKCVIPCAGKGTRLGGNVPKPLVEVNGRSLLEHITYQWSGVVDSFVVIVSPQNERQIKSYLKGIKTGVEFVTQSAPVGLADAIYCAQKYVEGKFIVSLGDCLFKGRFDEVDCELGIATWCTDFPGLELFKNFAVVVDDDKVVYVQEKPEALTMDAYCGMGVYFLDERVFDYIRSYGGPSGGGDFTAVLQNMINAGEEIKSVRFRGEYANINTQEDLKKAEAIFK